MGVFTPVELEWRGKIFTIKPHRVMGMISRIEDTITFEELRNYCLRGAPPMGKLCTAYASALQYAGALVSADEVYEYAFSGELEQVAIMEASMGLMKMMLPPSARARVDAALAESGDAEPPSLETDPGNSRATVAASSKKPTRRRSQGGNG